MEGGGSGDIKFMVSEAGRVKSSWDPALPLWGFTSSPGRQASGSRGVGLHHVFTLNSFFKASPPILILFLT